MTLCPNAARLERYARYELFEERLALSAQSVGPDLPDSALEHHFHETTPFHPGRDFQLDTISEAVEHHRDDLRLHLNDAHSASGVEYVHDTYGFDGTGQTVVIIDSGIAYDHLALGGGFGSGKRVVGGYDFAENDADPYDDGPAGFHGTHVAGIVGSSNMHYRGVAPGVDLVALRVFDDQGSGQFGWVEQALAWVHQNRFQFANPITTVNLSLGTDWNASHVPNWAMLEDEFAQLKADGLFVSVSAGNSFQEYQAKGLSYPAASSYVVPVASLDSDGSLSAFSQRHERVLAAPGRSITSTVPDHVFGADGTPNDFGTASGTSMAAPYVAGASALVRQAMQFVGLQGITQDTIYDHLRNTAQRFYDAATRTNYHRLDLQAALQALMPADDYGSTLSAAHNLGQFGQSSTITGVLGSRADRDYFTFQATVSGTAQVSLDTLQGAAPLLAMADRSPSSGNTLTFDVVAGQTYGFYVAASDQVAKYALQVDVEQAITDWGQVASLQVQDQNLGGSSTWFQFTASRAGLLTVESFFDAAAGDVNLQLFDSRMTLLASSATSGSSERVDAAATAGASYYLQVSGANRDVDFRITNLIAVQGSQWTVSGTDGNDRITVDMAARTLQLNDVGYSLDANVRRLELRAGGGQDRVTVHGTQGNETALARPGTFLIRNVQMEVQATESETIVLAGRGGMDRIHMHDSAGADRFFGTAEYALMQGPQNGYYNYVTGFEQVFAFAGRGDDRAFLYDSAGSDRFFATPGYGLMHAANNGFYHFASGFGKVYGHSGRGGTDYAFFYDSAGDDRFTASPTSAQMDGDGFARFAQGFRRVYANAQHGGQDRAFLYDSSGDDRLFATPVYAQMEGAGDSFYHHVRGFGRVFAYAQGGFDRAFLYDSAGNDRYFGTAEYGLMQGESDSFYNYAAGFDRVYAFARSGADRAHLFDSSEDDFFDRSRDRAAVRSASGAYHHATTGFARVYAYSNRGGRDSAQVTTSAQRQLSATASQLAIQDADRFTYLDGFGQARVLLEDEQPEVAAIDYLFAQAGR